MASSDGKFSDQPDRCRVARADHSYPQRLSDSTGLTFIRLRHPDTGQRAQPDLLVPLCGPVSQRAVSHLSQSLIGGIFSLVPIEHHHGRSIPRHRPQFIVAPRAARTTEPVVDEIVALEELEMLGQRLPAEAAAAETSRRSSGPASIGELAAFASRFRRRREEMRYCLPDACLALRRLYNCHLSPSMLGRFELADLSLDNMSAMRPTLQRWLADIEAREVGGPDSAARIVAAARTVASGASAPASELARDERRRPRQSRARLTGSQVAQLERHFLHTPNPSRAEINALCAKLALPLRAVRGWFSNRRQRERRADPDRALADTFHTELSVAMVGASQPQLSPDLSPEGSDSCN